MLAPLAALLLATPAPLVPAHASEGKPGKAWALSVRLAFDSEDKVASFHKLAAPLIDHVKADEPTTKSFTVLTSDQDPLVVLVLERFDDKASAYEKVHRKSPQFLDFRPELSKLKPVINGSSYDETGIGFYERNASEYERLASGRNASTAAWCLAAGLFFESEEQVEQVLKAAKPFAEYLYEQEPTTLGYLVMRSDQDPKKVMIFERFADRETAYLSIHRTSEAYLTFQKELEQMDHFIDEMEPFREEGTPPSR